MTHLDRTGLALTAASEAAVAAWDAFLDDYCAFRPTVPDRLRTLLEADGAMPLALTVRAALLMLSGKGDLAAVARKSAAAAVESASGATRRERLHAEAVAAWSSGDVAAATARWELALALEPRDLLALKLAQFSHFYAGDTEAMRRSVDGVADAWDAGVPRYGRYLGVRAFSLEEDGDLDAAEAAGREAVERGGDDAWAIHAVAHCLETRGAPAEGRRWIDACADGWADAGTMDGHLRWHRALFDLELDGPDALLERFDDEVRVADSEEYLDLCNDVAMLQRLELRGVDVSDRWTRIADAVELRAGDRLLAFCDAHWALGLAAAGRFEAAGELVDAIRAAGTSERSDADAFRSAALPLAEGLVALRRGDAEAAFAALWAARDHWHLLGGSRAQRDLFHQLLCAAAARAGENDVLRRLLRERTAVRPHERPWLEVAA
jgi:hypothetical protein